MLWLAFAEPSVLYHWLISHHYFFLARLARMIVELHRKVSSLIEFLKQKWALHEVRIVSFYCCSEEFAFPFLALSSYNWQSFLKPLRKDKEFIVALSVYCRASSSIIACLIK